jgi:hypothetical protein
VKSRLTRRKLSGALFAVPLLAQTPPAAGPKPEQPKSAEPEQDLRQAASRQVRNAAEELRKFSIPIETEPAFRFKA